MRDLRQEHRMHDRWTLLTLAASLLCVPSASGL
ncbi:TolB-like protein, partial [Xanthomonas oryzae pv. oryzae]